jgi:hypothetical protein
MDFVLGRPIAPLIKWIVDTAVEEALRDFLERLRRERRTSLAYLDDTTLPRDCQAIARLRGEVTLCDVMERSVTSIDRLAVLQKVVTRVDDTIARAQQREGV